MCDGERADLIYHAIDPSFLPLQLPLVLSRIRQLSGEQLSAFLEELFRKFFSQEKALLEQLRLLESEVSPIG